MSDIVQRLRDSVRACRALDRSALLAEAADEIERLRLRDAEQAVIENMVIQYSTATSVAVTLRGLLDRVNA